MTVYRMSKPLIVVIVISLFKASLTSNAPGILLETNSSVICSDVPLRNIDNFVLCSFLRLNNETSNLEGINTIFELQDANNDTFELTYGRNGEFTLNYKKRIIVYPKLLEFNDWTKLCIIVEKGSEIQFEVNYRITRNITEEYGMYETSTQVLRKDESSLNSSKKFSIRLCAGSKKAGKRSFIGALAGTILKQERETVVSPTVNETCVLETEYDSVVNFPGNFQIKNGTVKLDSFRLNELCWGTHVYLLLDDASYYDEHFKQCFNLNGRLALREEVSMFKDRLTTIYTNKTSNKAPSDPNSCCTWLFQDEKSRDHFCPSFDYLAGKFSSLECIVELEHSFCVIPKYTDIYYYGSLRKFDRHYTFEARNNSLFLKGDKRTWLQRENDYWVFRSKVHKEYLTLHNTTLPVGRNKWKNSDKQSEFLLTFTYCNTDQFTCTTGDCLPRNSRCNGTVECTDASDEEDCKLINKKRGYYIKKTPPPRRNEDVFTISHYSQLSGIDDITSVEGVALVDAYVTLTWYDPRIIFHNPVVREEVDCEEIWTPIISMADGVDESFQINFKSYRASCIVFFPEFNNTPILHKLDNDPYMGQYSHGKDVPITFVFSALITAPCRLNLKKYPFGIQFCNVVFWVDNAFLTSKYKMESHASAFFIGNDSTKDLEYFGRKNLGEYYFMESIHSPALKDRGVLWTFKLQNLFGFHLVNSFTPSVLMFIISYSTFYFPVYDFNERIMVSLTSLLVLAALFTQAAETSVRTPYFKYLDAWYVSLITFCFFIVIANVMIHKLESLGNKRYNLRHLKFGKNWPQEGAEYVDISNYTWYKKVDKINMAFQIFFAIFFVIFFVVYCLGASDNI